MKWEKEGKGRCEVRVGGLFLVYRSETNGYLLLFFLIFSTIIQSFIAQISVMLRDIIFQVRNDDIHG